MTLTRKCVLALLLPVLASSACDTLDTSGPSGDASVSVLLKDAPADLEAAVVTISGIYLQGEGDSSRVWLSQETTTTDLLTLKTTALELVKDVPVPAGRYSQLRFVITGGYIEVKQPDGGTAIYASSPDYEGLPAGAVVAGELQMPSMAQSGLKVELPEGSLEIEGETTLLVDFDLAQSFGHAAGQSGKWVMHPVIRAVDLDQAGTIEVKLSLGAGVTLPVLGGVRVTLDHFKARLSREGDGDAVELALEDEDRDGTFVARFENLLPGEYEVSFVLPAGLTVTFGPAAPFAVTLEAGETVTAAFEVTGVE